MVRLVFVRTTIALNKAAPVKAGLNSKLLKSPSASAFHSSPGIWHETCIYSCIHLMNLEISQ